MERRQNEYAARASSGALEPATTPSKIVRTTLRVLG
jgi:hypothetical protein